MGNSKKIQVALVFILCIFFMFTCHLQPFEGTVHKTSSSNTHPELVIQDEHLWEFVTIPHLSIYSGTFRYTLADNSHPGDERKSSGFHLEVEHPRTIADGDVSSYVFVLINITFPTRAGLVDQETLEIWIDDVTMDVSEFLVTPISIVGSFDDVAKGDHTLKARICNIDGDCSAVVSRDFRVGRPVFISSVTPEPFNVGDVITINGGGFNMDDNSKNTVIFGSGIWTYPSRVLSPGRMEVVVPEGSVSGSLRVGAEPYLSDPYEYTLTPRLLSVSPQIVPRGGEVFIKGAGFSGMPEDNAVRFCTNAGCSTYKDVKPHDASSTHMRVKVPESSWDAISGPMRVVVKNVVSVDYLPLIIVNPPEEMAEDRFNRSRSVTPGRIVIGSISEPGQMDTYKIKGKAGDLVLMDLASVNELKQPIRGGGTPDLRIGLKGPDGKTVAFNDDYRGTKNSHLEVVFPVSGEYKIEVSATPSGDHSTGFYRLSVQPGSEHRPVISDVSATVGKPGDILVVEGRNLDAGSEIYFGDARATIVSFGSGRIEVEVPPLQGHSCATDPNMGGLNGSSEELAVVKGSLKSNTVFFTWLCQASDFDVREGGIRPTVIIPGRNAVGTLAGRRGESDTDSYVFDASAGDAVSIALESLNPKNGAVKPRGGDPDLMVTVSAPDGTVIVYNDSHGETMNARLERFVLTVSGRYTVHVQPTSKGSRRVDSEGLYKLSLNWEVAARPPKTISRVSGNQQRTYAGQPLEYPLVMEVLDGDGNPVVGVIVEASVGKKVLITDAKGRVSVSVPDAGDNPGLRKVGMRVVGMSAYPINIPNSWLEFEFLVLPITPPGPPKAAHGNEPGNGEWEEYNILPLFGQNTMATVGTTKEICAWVVDYEGMPAPGKKVAFKVTGGGGSVSPPVVTTDEDGVACVNWTMGRCTGSGSCSPGTSSSYLPSTPHPTQVGNNSLSAEIIE